MVIRPGVGAEDRHPNPNRLGSQRSCGTQRYHRRHDLPSRSVVGMDLPCGLLTTRARLHLSFRAPPLSPIYRILPGLKGVADCVGVGCKYVVPQRFQHRHHVEVPVRRDLEPVGASNGSHQGCPDPTPVGGEGISVAKCLLKCRVLCQAVLVLSNCADNAQRSKSGLTHLMNNNDVFPGVKGSTNRSGLKGPIHYAPNASATAA